MNNKLMNLNITPKEQTFDTGGARLAISAIRLVAMIMIILCHIAQYYGCFLAWWFNAGVQIFLCISGFLYGQIKITRVTNFYKKRLIKILIPYYLVVISFAIAEFIFAPDLITIKKFIGVLFLHSTLKGAGHLWFVSTILICYLITPLLQAYKSECVRDKTSWIFVLICGIIVVSIYTKFFNVFFNPAWISCYLIGYGLGVNEEEGFFQKTHLLALFGFIALVGNSIQIYFEYILQISFTGQGVIHDYNHVFLGIVLFLILKMLFEKRDLKKIEAVLLMSDKYSYEVYCVHQLIILGPFSLLMVTNYVAINLLMVLGGIVLLAKLLKEAENYINVKLKNFLR